MHIFYKTLSVAFIAICGMTELSAQYNYKVIVDINQIHINGLNELPFTSKLKCDGIWSIPGNSAGNKGRDIPISEWQVGFNQIDSGFNCTEDYWRNFPAKNYDLTEDILGRDKINMVCGYAEPSITNDPHTTTVINDEVIDNIYAYADVPVVVLSRAYTGKWKTELTRALNNNKVAGVCYEQKPTVERYKQWDLVNGIRAVLSKNKKVFLLLPPQFSSESNNYTADITTIFNYLKVNAPEVLQDSNLYFVPNCYNRLKDKETSFYGGDNSVEGAIKYLLKQRSESKATNSHIIKEETTKVFPTIFTSGINVELSSTAPCNITIFNMAGRAVYESSISASSNIPLSKIKSGIYFVRITSNKSILLTQKIIKY